MTEAKTRTCRCRAAQLVLQQVRLYPDYPEGEDPKWIYRCPVCGAEAVAAMMAGSKHPDDGAPMFRWLAPAEEDDSELGGRVATPEEATHWGDILADSTSRDERGQSVVWM